MKREILIEVEDSRVFVTTSFDGATKVTAEADLTSSQELAEVQLHIQNSLTGVFLDALGAGIQQIDVVIY